MKLKLRLFLAVFFAGMLLTSCSNIMGYGVLLWSLPEKNLSDGAIVPVYILSNINNVYVIGIPGTDEKIEIPLWQITSPESKKKAIQKQAVYAEYQHKYAKVMYDGLPIREDVVNTSNQVYRLRRDEIIKVLYKGEGQSPMTGGQPLPGDWFKVLASDGTSGWCFSYNLKIFDEREQDVAVEQVQKEDDTVLQSVLAKRWWPENYAPLIKADTINLEIIKQEYGFITGAVSGITRLNMPDPALNVSAPFVGVTNVNANVYKFTDSPFTMTIRNENVIVIQYTNEKGMPTSYTLVAFSDSVDNIIAKELARRQSVYNTIVGFGPEFRSSNYGILNFLDDNKFTWNGYSKLVTSKIIPSGTNGQGSIAVKYFISKNIGVTFDGVLTFSFDKSNKEVNFLYKIEADGLRLESLSSYQIKTGFVESRDTNPLVMFFAKSVTDNVNTQNSAKSTDEAGN